MSSPKPIKIIRSEGKILNKSELPTNSGIYKIEMVEKGEKKEKKSESRQLKENVIGWITQNYFSQFGLFLPWIDSDIIKSEIILEKNIPIPSEKRELDKSKNALAGKNALTDPPALTGKNALAGKNALTGKKLNYIETNQKYRAIIGSMQSKKTPAIIAHAIYYALVYRIPTIIVIQNNISAFDQILTRIESLIDKILIDMKIKMKNKLLHPVCALRGKKANHTLIKKVLNGEACRIFITLRSESDLEPFNTLLKKKNTQGRLVMMIDESDFTDSGVESKAQTELDYLKEKASVIYFISATPFTNLFREDIFKDKVILLNKPEYYKDLSSVHFKKLPFSASACVNMSDDPFLKDPNLKGYLRDFVQTKPYTISINQQQHPVISICKIGTAVQPQNRVAKWLNDNYSSKLAVIVYNSDNISLSGGGTHIPGKTIILSNYSSSTYKKGVHYFKNVHVGLIIEYLQSLGPEKIKRIIILTGCMANRGITFGSTNYEECIKNNIVPWHVTEMYFIPSVSMDSGNLLQSAGRICGCYRDDIPLTLYTNVPNDILKAYHVQEEILHRSKTENPEQSLLKETMKTIPISKAKFTRRRVVSKAVCAKFNKVQTDLGIGGWNWHNKLKTNTVNLQNTNGKREREVKQPLSEEDMKEYIVETREEKFCKAEKERLIAMFEKWATSKSERDMKVANFMRLIVRNPNKIYTKEEIDKLCNKAGIARPKQLTYYKKDGNHAYGMILQMLPGDRYKLYPELISSAIDHFEE